MDLDEVRLIWKECLWLPGSTYSSDEAMNLSNDTLKTILTESRAYRYEIFEPEQIEIMGIDLLKGERVLEIGCGAGHDSITMAIHGSKVTSTDIVESNIHLLKRYAKLFNQKVSSVYLYSV